ncbi:MAG: phosphoribosylformylglycinamidine cyclo-ligase [Candidatus Aenigmarchaeota archaeon]|nr:phosphoribosylformylglycinamidine cyclo-ligase [Candidatus Aenigmarchaeota archaeon]
MEKEITYSDAGVNRNLRAESKAHLTNFENTHRFANKVIKLPYNTIYKTADGKYQDHIIEGIGTKVLIAQLANKFDTIGIDAVAMAVNDVIRSGSKPISLTDNIDIQKSDPKIIDDLIKGITQGAEESEVPITSGEIADVKELISGISENPFHIVCSCIGELEEKEIMWGNELEAGDAIIGLRSSGLHSNGISLARKILFKRWGGKYDAFDIPDGFDREIVYEALEPTKIYVKPFLDAAKEFEVKAAVHITGDAYLKFDKLMKFNPNIGFEFNSFNPHPIFSLIQRTASDMHAKITDQEMLKTFNLGWGFSVIVSKNEKDKIIDLLNRSGIESGIIGVVTNSKSIVATYNGHSILLSD